MAIVLISGSQGDGDREGQFRAGGSCRARPDLFPLLDNILTQSEGAPQPRQASDRG
jgi:hypothetical protein